MIPDTTITAEKLDLVNRSQKRSLHALLWLTSQLTDDAKFRNQLKTWNGNVQTKIRTNISEQFEGTTHENVGFQARMAQKSHPSFATNVAMEFHCPCCLSVLPKVAQRRS